MIQNMKLMKNCRVSIPRKILRHVIFTHFKAGLPILAQSVIVQCPTGSSSISVTSNPLNIHECLMIAVNDVDVIFPLVTDMYLVQRSQFPVSQKTENSWWKGRQS